MTFPFSNELPATVTATSCNRFTLTQVGYIYCKLMARFEVGFTMKTAHLGTSSKLCKKTELPRIDCD